MQIPSTPLPAFARLARIIGLLVLAAGLAACSGIKLAYNNLDDVAYWWLDSYVDFSDEQAPRAREDLARLHRWHRANELPLFAATLAAMEQLAPGEVSAAQACAFVPRLRERLNAVAERAEPVVVTMALGLSPEQLAHIERKFERVNADYRKDWLRPDRAAVREKRFEQLVERVEMIYGGIEEPQRAVLRTRLEQSGFDPRRWYEERRRRQADLMQQLRRLAGQPVNFDEARAAVRGWWRRTQESPDAAFRQYERAMMEEWCANFAAVHATTSPAQRQAAAQRLRAWQRDLRELAPAP